MSATTVALDLAKSVFEIAVADVLLEGIRGADILPVRVIEPAPGPLGQYGHAYLPDQYPARLLPGVWYPDQ